MSNSHSDSYDDPGWREFEKHVREDLVPKIEGTDLFVSIVPISKDRVDVEFAVELGLAILQEIVEERSRQE